MLTALELTAPALRHLSAPQCPSLYTLTLRGSDATAAPQLRTLNLMGCKSLPSRELHQVMAHAPQLHSLNVTACHQLGALVVPGMHSREHPYVRVRQSALIPLDIQAISLNILPTGCNSERAVPHDCARGRVKSADALQRRVHSSISTREQAASPPSLFAPAVC